MESAAGTASLRSAAARWSLAGDKQLLDILQNLHERIVTKCQEANSNLEEMVNTLDTASISLQNVNNRLMALSNSQFVESRVYEDDVDVATGETPSKDLPKPSEPACELSRLRACVRVLEAYHDPLTILHSDSDSGSEDEEDRVVYKPKDLYSERPLPYIIGSQQWRSKWHAGLVVEDSDSESDTSKANAPSEQYSESEPEDDGHPDKPHASQQTISSRSSLGSEEPMVPIAPVGVAKPADIAAEVARRLAGNVPHIPEPEAESPPAAAPPRVYRPAQPTTATIFSDEPPPLDCQSDHSDHDAYLSHSDDDVFAELHRTHRQTSIKTAAEQLFGNVPSAVGRKVDNGVDGDRQSIATGKQPSPLFEEPQNSDLFGDKPSVQQPAHTDKQSEVTMKKPVGGISLFGNNHGTESIGAAILKRNQRKATISDDEEPQQVNKNNQETDKNIVQSGHNAKNSFNNNIQKDILNDLFSKPSKSKQTNKKVANTPAVKKETTVNKKVDLFNDDLFDDLDDIFTNVKPPVKETVQSTKKSLFDDDDDDDLFADVAPVSNKTSSKPEPKGKSIFDSDDDLFNEEPIQEKATKTSCVTNLTNKVAQDISNDGLFSDNINKVSPKTEKLNKSMSPALANLANGSKGDESLTSTNSETSKEVKLVTDKSSLKVSKVKSIFDSDSDDDIFSDLKFTSKSAITGKSENIHNNDNTLQFANTIDEKTDEIFDSIPTNRNSKNKINTEPEELLEDDTLFIQKDKPLQVENIPTEYNDNSEIKNNANDEFEDNNKKTDEVLNESLDISSDIANSSAIHAENKLQSSTSSNESRIKNNEVSSLLSNTNAWKTQFQSPILFDEDDNLDDIFNKSSDSSQSKISSKIENSNQSCNLKDNDNSKYLLAEESKEAKTEISNKLDTHITSSKNSDLIASVHESQILQSKKSETDLFENDKQHHIGHKNTSNSVSDNLKESVPLASDDNTDDSIFIPDKPILEEEQEIKTDTDNISEETLFSNVKDSVLGEPDIFSDIFIDVPPEFERPKEPKKSKNVNALFDDDSDDEALFFKKNEIVSDDTPDVSFAPQDDRLFHIFHDEPPAMDVDFTQKPKKHTEMSDEIHCETNVLQTEITDRTKVKSLFKEGPQKEKECLDSESGKITDDTRKPVGKLKPVNFNINVNSLLPGASPKKTKTYEQTEEVSEQIDGQVISSKSSEDVKQEARMVKSVSFEDDPESEVLDNKLSKERAKIQVKRRPSTRRARKEAVRKSGIDFGDDSTDTSTSADISKKDNHSDEIDAIQTRNNIVVSIKSITTSKHEEILSSNAATDTNKQNSNNIYQNVVTISSDSLEEKHARPIVEPNNSLLNDNETSIVDPTNEVSSTKASRKQQANESDLTTAFNKRPNVKSKVVYILNDEDIFTDTKPTTSLSENSNKVSHVPQQNDENLFTDTKTNVSVKTQNVSENTQNVVKNKVLNIVDDDDELFKSGSSRSTNIATLGSVYKDVDLKTNKIDDLDSDEDIFKASQSKSIKNSEHDSKGNENKHEIDKMEAKIDKLFVKTQNTKAKTSLFDDLSDDESELFGSKTNVRKTSKPESSDGISTIIKKELKLPKSDMKKSLFDDESDDDDLFGVRKTIKKEPSQPSSKPKETVPSKPTEPVFEDPLSMLTQKDDI